MILGEVEYTVWRDAQGNVVWEDAPGATATEVSEQVWKRKNPELQAVS